MVGSANAAGAEAKRLRQTVSRILQLPSAEERAEQLALCVQKALDRFELVTREFQDRLEDLKQVFEVNRRMVELIDSEQLLPQVVEMVSNYMGVDRCSVMLLDETGEKLFVTVGLGFDRPVEDLPPVQLGKGIAGRVAASGRSLLVENIEDDERFRKKSGRQYTNGSLLCVPLKFKGRVIGVVNVNNKRDGSAFTESDEILLSSLGGVIAALRKYGQLHRQTQESWEYLNNVVEHISSGLLAVNAQGRVTLVNRAFKRLFGLEQQTDFVGESLHKALPDAVGRYFSRIVERTWREGNQREVEADIACADGRCVPADVNSLLLRDDQFEIQSQLIIVQDLSQSRELVKLRQLDTMKDNFISTVSHELRTPLTSMLASLALIRQGMVGDVSAQQMELLQIVHRNAERLKAIINDLLDLSRLESGRAQLNFERVDLDSLVQDCLGEMAQLAAEKGVHLGSSLAFRRELEADPMKVQQVLINLVGNALKFTPEGGRITVETGQVEDGARVRVRDTGCGIPQDELEKVFLRFYQVEDTLTRSKQGTGLGLPICKRIVELHGGRIRVESQPEQGCCFEFVLPWGGRQQSVSPPPELEQSISPVGDAIPQKQEEG